MIKRPLEHFAGLELIAYQVHQAGLRYSGTTSLIIEHLGGLFEVRFFGELYHLYFDDVFLVDEKKPELIAKFLLSDQLRQLLAFQKALNSSRSGIQSSVSSLFAGHPRRVFL